MHLSFDSHFKNIVDFFFQIIFWEFNFTWDGQVYHVYINLVQTVSPMLSSSDVGPNCAK